MSLHNGLLICTVTHNSAAHLAGWWEALCALDVRDLRVRVVAVDCASNDNSVKTLRALEAGGGASPALQVIAADDNLGFAGGMNRCLAELKPHDAWALALNPDARPHKDCLPHLVSAFTRYTPRGSAEGSSFRVGSVTARLVRPQCEANEGRVLDACGMRWTRQWRHLDRGSSEPDDGRLSEAEEVFAGTGAGTLYSLEALHDVALPPSETSAAKHAQPFDEDFHSFREDAELGLRLQRRDWRCIYEPQAVIEHGRYNLPERRSKMSTSINYHSLKNRYLLRLLHQSPFNLALTLPALIRDLAILPYVLLRERSSLRAYTFLIKHRARLLRRRRWLKAQQTAPNSRVNRWFSADAFPLSFDQASEP